MKDKETLYIDIAKACLAALNQNANASPQQAYEQVYKAIDAAMQEQFGPMLKDYDRARNALHAIAELKPEDYDKAPDLALAALSEQH